MPTYTYGCEDCGHRFDAFQRFADDPLRECPACGSAIRRVIQPVGIVFKGSGWYINDSRPTAKDGGSAPAAKGADEPKKADGAAGGDGTTAKPAAEKSVAAKPSEAKSAPKPEKATVAAD